MKNKSQQELKEQKLIHLTSESN